MSTAYLFLNLLVLLLPPQFAQCSCPPISNFACGPYNLSIEYPFFTDRDCSGGGLHYIQCINLVPLIQFHGEGFLYPVCNISYRHRSLVVHDLKLSAYFRGSDCVFLYDFSSPVPRFNVSNVTDSLSSGKSFFDCDRQGGAYDFSHDVFEELHNFTPCRDYTLFYSSGSDNAASSCPTSSDLWFDWKLSFGDGGGDEAGGISLLSAGFSRKWTLFPGCFDCRKTGVNCTGSIGAAAGEQSSCGCRSECWRASKGSSKSSWKIILGVLASVIGFLLVCGICLLCYRRRSKQRLYSSTLLGPNSTVSTPSSKKELAEATKCVCAAAGVASFIIGSLFITLWCPSHKREVMDAESKREVMDAESVRAIIKKHGSLVLRSYTYPDVKKITKSFSEKLGQGGYGTVFKGKLFDGHLVAVKVLSESKGNGEDFINEVVTIGQTSHVNVVTLRGFCVQGSKRALIYDFMPNGSLEKYISSENNTATEATLLRWEKLYEIVIGIARGLEYLHRGCNTRIVHFDIKPHNILLDQDLCPKISDFGMAKLCPGKRSIISMEGARGTIGYIAPEVFSRTFGTVSSKSDVYSYGMVLLEMFGGKRKRSSRLDCASDAYFPNWIYEHIDQNDNLTAYGVTSETEEIARKMMIVGFWCIQTMPENRPSMSRVVDMLEGNIKDLSIPPKPCLSSPDDLIVGPCATSST